MIGRLSGRVGYRGPDHVLIDVGGVGYVVHCSERTLLALPGEGEAAALFTEMQVREDAILLYGFLTPLEREWHRMLTTVQGVGAKAALAMLGALGPEAVGRAIALGDAAAFRKAPGVGPKLAERVVRELKDKAAVVMAMGSQRGAAAAVSGLGPETPQPGAAARPAAGAAEPANGDGGHQADALSALLHLGYAPGEAAAAIAAVEDADDTATLIRAALRQLAPKDGR